MLVGCDSEGSRARKARAARLSPARRHATMPGTGPTRRPDGAQEETHANRTHRSRTGLGRAAHRSSERLPGTCRLQRGGVHGVPPMRLELRLRRRRGARHGRLVRAEALTGAWETAATGASSTCAASGARSARTCPTTCDSSTARRTGPTIRASSGDAPAPTAARRDGARLHPPSRRLRRPRGRGTALA